METAGSYYRKALAEISQGNLVSRVIPHSEKSSCKETVGTIKRWFNRNYGDIQNHGLGPDYWLDRRIYCLFTTIEPKEWQAWASQLALMEEGYPNRSKVSLIVSRVSQAVNDFFKGESEELLRRVGLPVECGLSGKIVGLGRAIKLLPTVLWTRESSDGKVLKVCFNLLCKLDEGSRLKVYKVPVVSIVKDTDEVTVKAKTLLYNMETDPWLITHHIQESEKGAVIAQVIHRLSQCRFVAPAPRRLEYGYGMYMTRNFLGNLSGIKMSFEEKIQVLEDAARGLAAFHEAGFVHYDVKHSNIMVFKENGGFRGCLSDFNLSRRVGESEPRCSLCYPYWSLLFQPESPFDEFPVTEADDLQGFAQTMAGELLGLSLGGSLEEFLGNEQLVEEMSAVSLHSSSETKSGSLVTEKDVSSPPYSTAGQETNKAKESPRQAVFNLVKRIFEAEKEFASVFSNKLALKFKNPIEEASRIFSSVTALKVADELERIRLEMAEAKGSATAT